MEKGTGNTTHKAVMGVGTGNLLVEQRTSHLEWRLRRNMECLSTHTMSLCCKSCNSWPRLFLSSRKFWNHMYTLVWIDQTREKLR